MARNFQIKLTHALVMYTSLLVLLVTVSGFSPRSIVHRRVGSLLAGGKGFGDRSPGKGDTFPSIDAFAKDPNRLLNDRTSDVVEAMAKGPIIDQFSKEREKKFDFNDLEFPCRFTLKVIGEDTGDFLETVLSMCCAVTKEEVGEIRYGVKKGKKGHYLSVTVSPLFTRGEDIYRAYEVLNSDSRVKFVL